MRDTKILNLFKSRLKRAAQFREPFEKKWTTLTNMYNLKHDYTYNFMAILADYADEIEVRWVKSIIPGTNFFSIAGRNFVDDTNAKNMDSIVKYQATNEMYLAAKLKQAFEMLSYLGNQVAMVGWKGDRPFYRGLSLFDIWFDTDANNIQDGWIITREKIRYGRLLDIQKAGGLKDVENILRVGETNPKNEKDKPGYSVLESSLGVDTNNLPIISTGGQNETEDNINKEFWIYQMWTDEQSIIIEPITGEILSIPPHENKFGKREIYKKPFVLLRPLPTTGVIYGRSPVERLIVIQDEINELRFDRRKKKDLIIQGIMLAIRGSGVQWDKFRSDGIITATSDISEKIIRRLEVTNILPILDNEEDRLIMYADKHTGIYDPQRGGGAGDVTKTARGLELLTESGNIRFDVQASNIQIEGIRDIIEQIILLNQENMGTPEMGDKIIRITDKDWTVKNEELQGNFNYIPISAPGLGADEGKQLIISNLQTKYAQDPRVDQNKMTSKEFEAYNIDPDEVMLPEDQIAIAVQNQQLVAENEQLKQLLLKSSQPVQPEKPKQEGMV